MPICPVCGRGSEHDGPCVDCTFETDGPDHPDPTPAEDDRSYAAQLDRPYIHAHRAGVTRSATMPTRRAPSRWVDTRNLAEPPHIAWLFHDDDMAEDEGMI